MLSRRSKKRSASSSRICQPLNPYSTLRAVRWGATFTCLYYIYQSRPNSCTMPPMVSPNSLANAPKRPSRPRPTSSPPDLSSPTPIELKPTRNLKDLGHHTRHQSCQNPQSKLWYRQVAGSYSSPPNPGLLFESPPDGDGLAYTPYRPTVALHASIIPLPTSNTDSRDPVRGSSAHQNHTSTREIVYIASGSILVLLLGLMGIFLFRSWRKKKHLQFGSPLGCCCRRAASRKAREMSDKGALVLNDDDDDPTWGTPTRMMYVESINESIDHHDLELPVISIHAEKTPTTPELLTCSAPVMQNLACLSPTEPTSKDFDDRLRGEEKGIALALNLALRDIVPKEKEQAPPDNPIRDAFSLMGHEENVSIFKSLQASIDCLARGVSFSAPKNRPRQGSDASAGSQETTSPDVADCFSVASSSRSSMTSLASTVDEIDEDACDVYEVTRAQIQSLEIQKGVLIAWKNPIAAPADIPVSTTPPTVIISEPPPTALSSESESSHDSIYSLEASCSSTGHVEECQTVPSLSSLISENSRGTISSLATSFSTATRTEGRCTDDDGYLLPPIPYLMVTHPSTSTIHTLDSAASSISIDLNDFPLPPLPVKPVYSKFIDQAHLQKRVWDNHPVDSTMAQKRSTVEQFIMMYTTN